MSPDLLATVMTLVLSREFRHMDSDHAAERTVDISALADIDVRTGEAGALVSPEVDPFFLATIQYYEGRFMRYPRDGDRGVAVGPMQLVKTATWWAPNVDVRWKGLTVEQLRIPEVNVRVAYSVFMHYKKTCGGPPGVWITAYGWGKCPGKYIDWEGRRRCKLLDWMLDRAEKRPQGWSCLHSGG